MWLHSGGSGRGMNLQVDGDALRLVGESHEVDSSTARLEALSWPVGLAIRAYGLRIGFRASQPIGLAGIEQAFPYEWRPSSSPNVDRLYSIAVSPSKPGAKRPRYHRLYVDRRELYYAHDLELVRRKIESDLHLYVGEMAHHRVFVHAGVVGYRGKAIVMPGDTLAGKTTLVAEFLRRGAQYYSDDFAVLDLQGRVHPYAKPLGMRQPGSLEQTACPPHLIGSRVGSRPIPVGLVLVTRYEAGRRWVPERLSPGRGVLELLRFTLPAQRAPETALVTLERVASRATVLAGPRGEACEIADDALHHLNHVKFP